MFQDLVDMRETDLWTFEEEVSRKGAETQSIAKLNVPLILLENQDRSLWNREQIGEGLALP